MKSTMHSSGRISNPQTALSSIPSTFSRRCIWGTSSELYFKIEQLLRELSNPNLHGIFPVSAFQIELWDRHAQHVRWVIAASASVTVAQAALDVAISEYPNQHLTLRKGAMVLRQHVPNTDGG
jgi:hypothetical protein